MICMTQSRISKYHRQETYCIIVRCLKNERISTFAVLCFSRYVRCHSSCSFNKCPECCREKLKNRLRFSVGYIMIEQTGCSVKSLFNLYFIMTTDQERDRRLHAYPWLNLCETGNFRVNKRQ